ncbi:hypothetical protein J4760_12630 [Salinicoccus sp. ID82-1]|uniref:hypothetical protein n=1 Tax=Salinicoccus sp. ID82-1 TaxID=2820269 RepID=UPI001F1EB1F0|nr:hypothetical protein [Salinicoccus sp. ID82-1]MCG1010868.1 hypothetical protein [Salinicoccus sp. ID82-1]
MSESVRGIIFSAYDRLEEAHWNIHQMEYNYHDSDAFRYSLNSFLRVIKEVPQILQMELQSRDGFTGWYKEQRKVINEVPLIKSLFKQRDIVVHQSILKPNSSATLGITEGRGIKLGLNLPLNPFQDSDFLMVNYLLTEANSDRDSDVLGILSDDEDQLPCIERYWRLAPFEEDILELTVQAWETIASLIRNTIIWLDEDPSQLRLSIDCIHTSSSVALLIYKREWIEVINAEINNGKDINELLYLMKVLRNTYQV